MRRAALTPPHADTEATDLGAQAEQLNRLLGALARARRIVRLGELYFHADALRELKERTMADRLTRPTTERVTLDVGDFKSRHALTRKHAIPLLEWLDREGVTRRLGDTRVVLPRAQPKT